MSKKEMKMISYSLIGWYKEFGPQSKGEQKIEKVK
jgi:hypothetical protein